MYKIRFYKTENGKDLMDEFLEKQPIKVQSKMRRYLSLLSKGELPFRRPYIDTLRNGIKELRVIYAGNQYRSLFYFFLKDYLMFTHGFTKKTNKVPEEEIERAIRIKNDFENRYKKGGYKL